jgi:hypothetical protein
MAKGPPEPSMSGDWRVIEIANGAETRLELEQRDQALTGTWYIGVLSVHVSGTIMPSNRFTLSGYVNNDTLILNAEATDGFGRFTGTRLQYDVRGLVKSQKQIRGVRA